MKDVPDVVVGHIRRDLGLGEDVAAVYDSDRTRGRHRTLIRRRSEVVSDMPAARAAAAIAEAAWRKNDPADLINVALEKLVEASFELPGYSTMDEMAAQIREARSTRRSSRWSPTGWARTGWPGWTRRCGRAARELVFGIGRSAERAERLPGADAVEELVAGERPRLVAGQVCEGSYGSGTHPQVEHGCRPRRRCPDRPGERRRSRRLPDLGHCRRPRCGWFGSGRGQRRPPRGAGVCEGDR
jgi:hypothetical protein